MADPMFFIHPCGIYLSFTETPNGYALSAYDPKTKRELCGFEPDEEAALSWANGARLVLSKTEGST